MNVIFLPVKEDAKGPFSSYDYSTVSQHFNPVIYSTGINNIHFIVLLQSLSEATYQRGKFSACKIGGIQNPVTVIRTQVLCHNRKLKWFFTLPSFTCAHTQLTIEF